MTETTKNSGDKLSVSSTKTLTLKRGGVEQGVVRQSFSHGRSKAVVVEKVKRRIGGPGEARAEPLAAAQLSEHEERERGEEEAKVRRGREETERVERAASEARKLNEESRRKH